MKKKLLSSLFCAAVFSAVYASITVDDLANNHVKAMRDDGSITNVINTLVTSGVFCQARGHMWQPGCGLVGCITVHAGPMRYCPLCKRAEQREIGPWK